MNTLSNFTPPCLVLTVGAQAEQIALDAQMLALRGNPWHSASMCFISVRFSHTADTLQAACETLKAAHARKAKTDFTRQQIYAATLHSSADLRASLANALHDLRTHEKTVLAGHEEKRAFTLRVVLLADLTQPESAAVFPLMALLDDLLSREPDKQMLLLLQIAHFARDKPAAHRNACCHTGLRDLQALFSSGKNDFQKSLARDLALPGLVLPPSFAIILFDRIKEGGWEVKDEHELLILSANFLLATLICDFTEQAEPFAWHSGGATALFYDPQALIDACAVRTGLEFIRREFNGQASPDGHVLQQVTTEMDAIYGKLRGWLDDLTSGTTFSTGAGETPGLETHFADLGFEDLPPAEWSCAIQGYDTHFEQAVFPSALEKLKSNALILVEKLSQEQADGLEALPRQGRLYPGGLAACRKIIAELRQRLRARNQQFPAWGDESFSVDQLTERVELTLRRLDQAVEALPHPPHWFALLPFSFDKLAKHLFALLYLRKEQEALVKLRQQAVLALESKYALQLEKEARQALKVVYQRLDAELDQFDQTVQAFEEEVRKTGLRLESHSAVQGTQSIFRPSGVDVAVLDWATEEFKKPVEEIRYLFFDERDFLFYWRDMDAHNLETILTDFISGMYRPLLTFNIDQILSHRVKDDVHSLWITLSQGSMPLLCPDFDLGGGSGQSFQSQHLLCGDPRSSIFASFLRQPLATWEALATGDPTLAMCVRLRHNIPQAALAQLLERGQADFEKLSEDEVRGQQLFGPPLESTDKEVPE